MMESLLISYLIVNALCGTYQMFDSRNEIMDVSDRLKSTIGSKFIRIVICIFGVIIGMVLASIAWSPVKLLQLIKRD